MSHLVSEGDDECSFQPTTASDALIRVQTGLGIRPVDLLGNFHMTNTTEMILGTIESDKSLAVDLKHDDKLSDDSTTYAQVKNDFDH